MTNGARPSMRGMLVCVAMFVLGGAVLWGLFLAPRARPPRAPGVPWGTPSTVVRFVSVDLSGGPVRDPVAAQVAALDADYVLVQNIRFDEVLPLAQRLGMGRAFHPALFQRPNPRAKDLPGHLVLSKHPLYDSQPMWDDVRIAAGVTAVGVIDGLRFTVGSGVAANDESLAVMRPPLSGLPPAVIVLSLIQGPRGGSGPASDLLPRVSRTERMVRNGPEVPVSTIYADGSWVAVRTDVQVVGGETSILYAELKASHESGG